MQQNKNFEIIRKASREIVREFGLLESKCAGIDVSYAEGHALIEIKKHGTLTAGELAVILNLNRSSTTRTLSKLKAKGWVNEVKSITDAKKKPVALTLCGQTKLEAIDQFSNSIVKRAFNILNLEDREKIIYGLSAFAKALRLSRVAKEYTIRPIQKEDNNAIRQIIINVSKEFKTDGKGGPTADTELNDLYNTYSKPGAVFFVAIKKNQICGGAGIAPLKAGRQSVCEFQKMYLLPQFRGQGIGEILMKKCREAALKMNYEQMYIETVARMTQAINLYQKFGAKPLCCSLGDTGHHQCESQWIIDLNL